jgi:hypothetical protein
MIDLHTVAIARFDGLLDGRLALRSLDEVDSKPERGNEVARVELDGVVD